MTKRLTTELKDASIECMTQNMIALRTMLHLSQEDLAGLLGVGRQTLVAIETRKRKMTWSMFLALMFIFSQRRETKPLLDFFPIYSQELKNIYCEGEIK